MRDHETFYKQVGQKIRNRRGKSLSQEALASAVGLTRTSISNIESGRQKMLLHTLVDIADALRADVASLLPERPVATEPLDTTVLAQLRDNERSWIETEIGIKAGKGNNGRQTKENTGTGGNASARGGDQRRARPGAGDRAGKGRTDRD